MPSVFHSLIAGVETNFDDMFDPDIIGDGPAAAWLEDIAGVPVRYASIVYGQRGPDTGYEDSGVDVASLWARKGSASYINQNVLPALVRHYNVNSSAPVMAVASFTFNRDGTVTFSPSEYANANWKTPPSATAGDEYDIRFTQTGGNASGSLSGTLTVWLQLNQARGLTLTMTRNTSGSTTARRIILVEMRRRSDLAVVYSFSVTLEAEADIS